jgi:diguanylate cyclase (GGDEF)-like protein
MSSIDSKRIFVVEDDPGIRRIVRFQLEAAGYEVCEAPDGKTALEKLEEVDPDLVLLDFMMPHLSGQDVCRRIREHRRYCDLPIIFLTAKADLESRLVSLKDGANDYLTKPFESKELLLRIRNLLGWGESQRDRNPLTGLPGNLAIESELQGRLARDKAFAFLYVDLDHFKAYNDFYGYRDGDNVIRLLSEILSEAVRSHGDEDGFVGHVGGDDFVVITAPESADAIGSYVISNFDQRVRDLYRAEEQDAGYVEVMNRLGELERSPLLSTTIAVVESDQYQITHVAMLIDLVTDLKRRGKQHPGSVVVRDQRRPQAPRTGSDG